MRSATRGALAFAMDISAGYDGLLKAALRKTSIQKRCKPINSAPCKVYIYMLVDTTTMI